MQLNKLYKNQVSYFRKIASKVLIFLRFDHFKKDVKRLNKFTEYLV